MPHNNEWIHQFWTTIESSDRVYTLSLSSSRRRKIKNRVFIERERDSFIRFKITFVDDSLNISKCLQKERKTLNPRISDWWRPPVSVVWRTPYVIFGFKADVIRIIVHWDHCIFDLESACQLILSSSDESIVSEFKLSMGFVGLPNVGKSTLTNFLAGATHAEAANYP